MHLDQFARRAVRRAQLLTPESSIEPPETALIAAEFCQQNSDIVGREKVIKARLPFARDLAFLLPSTRSVPEIKLCLEFSQAVHFGVVIEGALLRVREVMPNSELLERLNFLASLDAELPDIMKPLGSA